MNAWMMLYCVSLPDQLLPVCIEPPAEIIALPGEQRKAEIPVLFRGDAGTSSTGQHVAWKSP